MFVQAKKLSSTYLNVLKHFPDVLEVYTEVVPTPEMMGMMVRLGYLLFLGLRQRRPDKGRVIPVQIWHR